MLSSGEVAHIRRGLYHLVLLGRFRWYEGETRDADSRACISQAVLDVSTWDEAAHKGECAIRMT